MQRRTQNLAILALLSSFAGVWTDICAARASQVPGEQDIFYRRYRGDDEVDDDRRGRGRGGRSGSGEDHGSNSDGGGGKGSSGGGSSDDDKKPNKQQSPSQNDNASDDIDRFSR